MSAKTFKHGDFLRIALPPAYPRGACEVSTRETAANLRRNAPRPHHGDNEQVELMQIRSGKVRDGRIISQSGGHEATWNSEVGCVGAPGTAEEASWDSDATDNEERLTGRHLSLLQLDISFHRQAFVGLRPPGNPDDVSEWISRRHEQSTLESDLAAGQTVREQNQQKKERYRKVMMRLPEGIDGLAMILQPWCLAPLRLDFPATCDFPGVGLQYLAGCSLGWRDDIECIHIYTDGSFLLRQQVAAGAFAVFGTTGNHESRAFLGWKGGTIITDPNDPHFTGAQEHSPLEAEASALLWAHLWMIQSGIHLPVGFYFGSCAAGNAASGLWPCHPQWIQGIRLRELVQFACALKGAEQVSYEHVKAHSNQPCNELVDTLAKISADLGIREFAGLPSWKDLFVQGDMRLSWSWWYVHSLAQRRTQPQICNEIQSWEAPTRESVSTGCIRNLVAKERD